MIEETKAAIIVITIVVIFCFFVSFGKTSNRNWDNYEPDFCETYNC